MFLDADKITIFAEKITINSTMKRFLSVFVLLVAVSVVCANPVSKGTARKIAEAFLNRNNMSQNVKRMPKLMYAQPSDTQEEQANLYMFNAEDGNGFVIVSGDDRTEPILGYSDTGMIDVDNMPVNMRTWLQHYSDEIALIQRFDLKTSSGTISDCGDAIPSAVSSLWNQAPIFNDLCPAVSIYSDENCTQPFEINPGVPADKLKTVTGCSATALAQILYTWKLPAATTAEIPAYEFILQRMIQDSSVGTFGTPVWIKFRDEAIPAGTTIDWDNMLDDYYGRDEKGLPISRLGTEEQRRAVANLMHICGAAMQMQYGPSFAGGSLVSDLDAARAAANYLGFKNTSICNQSQYTYQQWIQSLYNEVKVAKAVFFGGSSSSGGHAFVIDGYDKEDIFHVNWGWGGIADGYYRINSLLPEDQGIGGALQNDGFRINQSFLRAIYPGAPAYAARLTARKCEADEGTFTKQDDIFIVPNLSFRVTNLNAISGTFNVAIKVEGDDYLGYIDLNEGKPLEVRYLSTFYLTTNLTIPTYGLQNGDYYISMCYSYPNDKTYRECRYSENNRVKMTVNGNKITIKNIHPFEFAFVSSDNLDVYKERDEIDFTTTLKVTKGEVHRTLNTGLTSYNEKGEESGITNISRDIFYLDADDEFDVNFIIPDGLPIGKYSFYLYDDTFNYKVCTVEVKDATEVETVEAETEMKDSPIYNLNGQLVDEDYKGIVVKDGQKFFQNK